MAALRVLRPSSVWFLAAVARMSRTSSSGERGGSALAELCAGASISHTGASFLCLEVGGDNQCWMYSPPIKEVNAR